MNIALPAFLIFLLVLPGFIFRAAFRRAEKTDLDFRPFTTQTATGIIAAILLHAAWAALATFLTPYSIDSTVILSLLIGQKDDSVLHIAKEALKQPAAIISYFLSLCAFSYLSGRFLQHVVETCDWDKEGPLSGMLRFSTPWYYLFTGLKREDRDLDGVYVAAIVPLKDISYLYQGLLEEYSLDGDGKLDRLVLSGVSRRRFGEDYDDKQTDNSIASAGRFYPIDGNYFVLRYEEVLTLNIRYLKLTDI